MIPREEIISMAREAGFTPQRYEYTFCEMLERFTALVEARAAAAEREACARLCEAQLETGAHLRCAKAIRARGAA